MQGNVDKLPTVGTQLVKGHSGPVYTAVFNNQGEYCLTGSEDRSVCLYNPAKNLLIKNYKNVHNYDVYSIDVSRDNTKFVTGGGDKNIIVTDVVSAKSVRKYTGHSARVNSVVFNSENTVSASYDCSVRVWDNRADSYHPIDIIKGFRDSVSKVTILGAQIICSSTDGSVKFLDIRKGEVTTDSLSDAVTGFDIANSRRAYVVATTTSKLQYIAMLFSLIEKGTGNKIQTYSGHTVGNFGIDVVFNSRDTHLLTGSVEGKLYIYDLMRPQPVKVIDAHKGVLSGLGLHQTGGLVTAAHDGTVCYWKI